MRDPLPAPATQVDMYLHDIALSLRQLNDALAQIAANDGVAATTADDAQANAPMSEEDLILTPLREKVTKRRKQ